MNHWNRKIFNNHFNNDDNNDFVRIFDNDFNFNDEFCKLFIREWI